MNRIFPALSMAMVLFAIQAFSQTQPGPSDSAAVDSIALKANQAKAPIAAATAADENAAPADSEDAPAHPGRKPRVWGISGEIGFNSLSSMIGPVATFYLKPRIPLDLGVGLSNAGLRPGLRARYLFSQDKFAWFGAVGFKYALGSGDQDVKLKDADTKETFYIRIDPSPYLDLSLGCEFLANNGFLLIANAGYSALLGDKNFKASNGTVISENSDKLLKVILGSGIMLSVSVGKAF